MTSPLILASSILLTVTCAGAALALAGWVVARWSRPYTDSLEQLVLSLLSGETLLFALQATAYVANLAQTWVTGGFVLLLLLSSTLFVRDVLRRRIRPLEYLNGLLGWFGLTLLVLAGASALVVHGMPGTFFDWWEHYARTQIFLEHQSPQTTIGGWSLAARGPLFNAVVAGLLGLTSSGTYVDYSVVATLLNAAVILPLALLLRRIAGLSERSALVVGGLVLLLAPAFNWNLTFPWTKMAATGWILLALYGSLEGVRRQESRLVGWGIFAMAIAFLVHFMAFLYALMLLPCLVFYAWRKKLSLRPLLTATGAGLVVVGAWVGYLVHEFGFQQTLQANSTLGSYGGWGPDLKVTLPHRPSHLEAMGLNLASTTVPASLRALPFFRGSPLETPAREQITLDPPWQESIADSDPGLVFRTGALEAAVGWTGLILLSAAAVWGLRSLVLGRGGPFGGFWLYLVLVGLPVQFWATHWYCVYGILGHNLQPYLCLAVVLVARWLRTLPRWWRLGLASAWLLECGVRTALVLSFQMQPLPLQETPAGVQATETFTADHDYVSNYEMKLDLDIVMLRDRVGSFGAAVLLAGVLAALGILCFAAMKATSGSAGSRSSILAPD